MKGGKLAVCDSVDIIGLLLMHHTKKDLRRQATTAFVQREVGAVGGIARALQAATTPTDGQRMLQAGYQGAILGGKSRETIKTTTRPNGSVSVERLAETSVMMPNGQGVVLQQVQQVVQASASDRSSLLEDIRISNKEMALSIKSDVIAHIDNAVKKEAVARKKDSRLFKVVTDGIEARHKDIETKAAFMQTHNAALMAKQKDIEARATLIEAHNIALEAKNANLEQRLAAIEAGSPPPNSKKARTGSPRRAPSRPQKNITRQASTNTYGWAKTVKGRMDSDVGFGTIEEAKEAMEKCYNMH